MKEVQGPTPTGTSRQYRSLAEALRAHRIPEQNHDFIAQIVESTGVSVLVDRGRYIEGIRREGAPLHIGRTYTNGFTEDEQVVVRSGPLRLQPSEGRAPYFYVDHPSEFAPVAPSRAKRTGSSRASSSKAAEPRAPRAPKPVERDYGVCDVCFMVRNANGTCGCD